MRVSVVSPSRVLLLTNFTERLCEGREPAPFVFGELLNGVRCAMKKLTTILAPLPRESGTMKASCPASRGVGQRSPQGLAEFKNAASRRALAWGPPAQAGRSLRGPRAEVRHGAGGAAAVHITLRPG